MRAEGIQDKTEECTDGVCQQVSAPRVSRWDAVFLRLLEPRILLRVSMVLLFALYVRTIAFDFVYDDLTILISPWTESWKAVPAIFTHDIFGFPGSSTTSVYYRPLAVVWVLAVKQLTIGTPGVFHLLAVVIHVAVFYLAYVFGKLLFNDERLAVFAALLYSLHPSKVESVAWIGSSACDGIGGALFFATLICYLKWRETQRWAWLAGSITVFAAALLTKETMMVAPVLIALHYWMTSSRVGRVQRSAALMVPYGVAGLAYLLVRRTVLTATATTNYSSPSFTAFWNAPMVCWWYIKHLVVPTGLSVVYDSNIVTAPSLWTFVLPAVGLMIVLAAGVWVWFKRGTTSTRVMMSWFILALAPYVLMSVMVRQHDRYLYLAAYPFCALLAYLLLRAGEGHRRLRVVTAVAVIALYAGSTWYETGFWDNSFSLWTRARAVAPKSLEPQVQLALLYAEGRDVNSALQVLDDGLKQTPDSAALWQTRGDILYQSKRYSESREAFLRAISASRSNKVLAGSAYHLGMIDIADGNFASAQGWLRKAIAAEASNANYHRTLAVALAGNGHADEAKLEYEIAIRITRSTSRKY